MGKLKDFWFNVKYYLWTVPNDWWYDVKWFFKNLKRFWKQLWKFRTWDYFYCITLFADSLEWLANEIEGGHEEKRSAGKKVAAIRELVSLLKKTVADDEYGMMDKYWDNENTTFTIPIDKYVEKVAKERKKTLNRINRIIAGQDRKVFENIDRSRKDGYDKYVEVFDGTGFEGWWD
jgi:hypothetical protein